MKLMGERLLLRGTVITTKQATQKVGDKVLIIKKTDQMRMGMRATASMS